MTSTPTTPPATTLRAREPEDLLAAAPLVLGFAPTDSVVLMTFGGDRPFHARLDLPPRRELVAELAEAMADGLVGPARQQHVAAVVLLFYTDDRGAADRLWRPLRRCCARAGIEVITALRVDGSRYYPLRGDRRQREVGVPYDISAHPFLAQAVLDGQVTYRSRDDLVATLEPDPVGQGRVVRALTAGGWLDAGLPVTGPDTRAAGEWARELVGHHVGEGTTLPDADLARLVWQLQRLPVRDAVWALISRSSGAAHQQLWQDVVRRTPEPLVPAPAALLGWSAWQAGVGALAWAGVDRCRAADPDYRLAGLLAHMLEHAVPPDTVSGVADDWDSGLDD